MIEQDKIYLTAKELLEIVDHAGFYSGKPATTMRLAAEVFRLRAKVRYARRGPTPEEAKQLLFTLEQEYETAKRLASLREKARAAVDSYRDPEESVNSNTTEALFRELEAELG